MDKRGTKRKLEQNAQQEVDQPKGSSRRLNDGLSFVKAPRFGAFLPPAKPAYEEKTSEAGSMRVKLHGGAIGPGRANRRLAALARRNGRMAEAESWDAPEFSDAAGQHPTAENSAQLVIACKPTEGKASSMGMPGSDAAFSITCHAPVEARNAIQDAQQPPAGDKLGAAQAPAVQATESMSTASTERSNEAAPSGVPAPPALAFPGVGSMAPAATPAAKDGPAPAASSRPEAGMGTGGLSNNGSLDCLAFPTAALPAFGQPPPPAQVGTPVFNFGNSSTQIAAPANQGGANQQPAVPFAFGQPTTEAPQQPGLVFGQQPTVQVTLFSMHSFV